MQYRPEIDGLRALAVLPVVFFHAGAPLFSGGYVGVDVFFVISGYLITSIIVTERQQERFSLLNFYERRARRILPALFLVMFCSIPFAVFWMLPSDLKDFSQSLVAVVGFSSNVLFWLETGYWGVSNELKPLLHTWSLAVEEQYYLLFPLFLLLVWQYLRPLLAPLLLVLGALSLAWAQWGPDSGSSGSFFLLHTRAWEFVVGALAALWLLNRPADIPNPRSSKMFCEFGAALGLAMLAYAVMAFDETVPFPSLYTLVPTIGTALIILFASNGGAVGRLLSARPLVGIGLVSYSFYLWHQPVLALARHRNLGVITPAETSALLVLAFVLALVSWRYVEQPFRQPHKIGRRTLVAFALGGTLFFAGLGAWGHYNNGFVEWSFNKQAGVGLINDKLRRNYGLSQACQGSFTLTPECRTDDSPEILVWGDSYAMHLVGGFLAATPSPRLIQMTKSACGPMLDVAVVTKREHAMRQAKSCLAFNRAVGEWLAQNRSVKYVVLSSPFDQFADRRYQLLGDAGELVNANDARASAALRRTLDTIRAMGKQAIIFSPPPSNGSNLGRCLAKRWQADEPLSACNFSRSEMTDARLRAYALLDSISDSYRVIRLDEMLCSTGECITHLGEEWLFRDRSHLSNRGARLLGVEFDFLGLLDGGRDPENNWGKQSGLE